jgi:cytochrome c oxidase assembly protein subunit 11
VTLNASKTKTVISRRMAWLTALAIVVMFGFGFAMSPLYDLICRAVGVSSKPLRADGAPLPTKVDETRTVIVEFTGNAMAGLPWEFRPLTKKVAVHPGAVTAVAYYVRNPTSEAITAQAVPSLAPMISAEYFKKIECFCFTQQTLAPGEARAMPVRFYVDPALPSDVRTITLSYGFFNLDKTQAVRYGGEAAEEATSADRRLHAGHAASGS